MDQCTQGQFIAQRPEPGDLPSSDRGNERTMTESFAGMDIRKVDLDRRQADSSNAVTQRHACVRQTAGVEDQPLCSIVSRSLDAIN
jgi:hypothetical protein